MFLVSLLCFAIVLALGQSSEIVSGLEHAISRCNETGPLRYEIEAPFYMEVAKGEVYVRGHRPEKGNWSKGYDLYDNERVEVGGHGVVELYLCAMHGGARLFVNVTMWRRDDESFIAEYKGKFSKVPAAISHFDPTHHSYLTLYSVFDKDQSYVIYYPVFFTPGQTAIPATITGYEDPNYRIWIPMCVPERASSSDIPSFSFCTFRFYRKRDMWCLEDKDECAYGAKASTRYSIDAKAPVIVYSVGNE